MELDKLTEKIIGCAFDVSNTLGSGFVEKVYENALYHRAVKEGLRLEDIHVAQAMNYLKASGLPVCLLINFGRPKIEVRHLVPYDIWKKQSRPQPKYVYPRSR